MFKDLNNAIKILKPLANTAFLSALKPGILILSIARQAIKRG